MSATLARARPLRKSSLSRLAGRALLAAPQRSLQFRFGRAPHSRPRTPAHGSCKLPCHAGAAPGNPPINRHGSAAHARHARTSPHAPKYLPTPPSEASLHDPLFPDHVTFSRPRFAFASRPFPRLLQCTAVLSVSLRLGLVASSASPQIHVRPLTPPLLHACNPPAEPHTTQAAPDFRSTSGAC